MKKTIAKRNILLAGLLFIILFTISTVIRKPFDSAGFSMSDATYHVLLTMQAYDEISFRQHLDATCVNATRVEVECI